MTRISDFLDITLVTFGDYELHVGRLLLTLLAIALTFISASLFSRWFRRVVDKRDAVSRNHAYIVARLARYVILVAGFLIALATLGVEFGKLALLASALGIGIGLGLQGIVNNFVSGLAIMLERSLKLGDFIELDTGVVGEVKEIHMRATLVRTNDNVDILIPNADLTNGKVVNWTLAESIRRFRIPVGVAYGSDKELVRKAMLEAAESIPYTLKADKKPVVWMTGFGDSSINFILAVWVDANQVKRPTALTSDYLWAIDDAFRKYDIEIPFPQRDLHLKSSSLTLCEK